MLDRQFSHLTTKPLNYTQSVLKQTESKYCVTYILDARQALTSEITKLRNGLDTDKTSHLMKAHVLSNCVLLPFHS